jgi:hypothetical protein
LGRQQTFCHSLDQLVGTIGARNFIAQDPVDSSSMT